MCWFLLNQFPDAAKASHCPDEGNGKEIAVEILDASCTSAWSLEEPWSATLLLKHIIGPTNWFCPNAFAIPV